MYIYIIILHDMLKCNENFVFNKQSKTPSIDQIVRNNYN